MFQMTRREIRLFESATGTKVSLKEMFPSPPRQAPGVPPGKFAVFTYGEQPELVETFDTFKEAIEWVHQHDWESQAGYIILGHNGQGYGSDKAEAWIAAQQDKQVSQLGQALGFKAPHDDRDEQAFPESRKDRSKQLLAAVLEGKPVKSVLEVKRIPLKQMTFLSPKFRKDQAKLEKQKPRSKAPDTGHAPMNPGAPKVAPAPSKGGNPVSYKGKK